MAAFKKGILHFRYLYDSKIGTFIIGIDVVMLIFYLYIFTTSLSPDHLFLNPYLQIACISYLIAANSVVTLSTTLDLVILPFLIDKKEKEI